ncbi:uncharacterized protein F4807DRAFT_434689 [Annulohypoxylon truncatum]|uniref:uncharacterized protein n=1 Tax=Annulohypoxylon truncatum TaxID=327061 RepID=UPI002007EFB6|nr:uncharacterized protein F4807DRAFT_434689 [Annulohypoxylon truncatum]KAI1207471.1 hypothetical protein F4807DRAFT_434689 [Annulohypoxylon truncatum]
MKFSAILSMGLFAIAMAQKPAPGPAPPAPQDDLSICKKEAGHYGTYCPRCLPKCKDNPAKKECYYGTFSTINGIESKCLQHGGTNCEGPAVDQVCGK